MELSQALEYYQGGLSIIPIAPSGAKQPAIKWGEFQNRRPTKSEIENWFMAGNTFGAAVVLGPISSDLYCLDFDDCDEPTLWEWANRFKFESGIDTIPYWSVVQSPRGWHVYFRYRQPMKRKILAKKSKDETLIELRGDGQYTILPGSPPECHPQDKTYELKWGDEVQDAPEIDEVSLQAALRAARSMNSYVAPGARYTGVQELPAGDARPGTSYCTQPSGQ